MKQKLNDLKLMVQNDKKWLFLGGFLLLCVVLVLLSDSGGHSRRKVRPIEDKVSAQGMGAEESYKDLIESFKNDIESQKTKQEELISVIKRSNNEFSEHKKEVSGVIETLVDRYENLAREMDSVIAANANKPEQPVYKGNMDGGNNGPTGDFEKFSEDPTPFPTPPPPPKPTRVSVIVPGDAADVQLLTGVNAPVDGTPYPVVFKLNGAINGPDGATLPLGESRLVAAAQGSEVDSRALFRLSSLSIRHPSGRRSVVKVDGWVVGEDGIRGMNGKLIDKLGRLILATAGVSFAAALGDKLSGSNNSRNNNREPGLRANSSDFNAAAASALTDSSNRLGKLLLDRYESFVPVVEILANREAVAIFSQSAEISILDDDGDFEGGVYAAGFED